MKEISFGSANRGVSNQHSGTRRWLSMFLGYCMVFYTLTPLIVSAQVSGNIHPYSIEIDNTANLFNGNGVNVKNSANSPFLDWVLDSDPNVDAASFEDGVAVGLLTNVTAASGGVGHWNGVRLVDAVVSGTDQNIFLQGGKVNEPLSWNIGPGTVGSSKFDATQAFLANNLTSLFFGMQRSGNNGTTAFDLEFTQLAPISTYIPNRSDGDILFSFELQGSGGDSGSIVTYVFRFDGDDPTDPSDPVPNLYVPFCDEDPTTNGTGQAPCAGPLFTSVNADSTTPEPWGYINSHNDWVLSPSLNRRLFAEVQVPLSLLPGVNTCGGSAFVQVRTRASSALGSDAKDTTRIFRYSFGGPIADGDLSTGCGLNISYDGTGSTGSGGGGTLTYSWQFQKNSLDDGSGTWSNVGSPVTGATGTFTAPSPGRYRAILTITENEACTDDVITNEVNVYNVVGGSATLTPDCDDTFEFFASGTGGTGSYFFEWTIYKEMGATDPVAKTFTSGPGISSSGTLDVDDFNPGANGNGAYYAVVKIVDASNAACFFSPSTGTVNIRHLLTASAVKTSATTNANQVDGSFSVLATGSTNADPGDPIAVVKQWQQFTGGAWSDVGGDSATLTRTMSDIISLGVTDGETLVTILSDPYSMRRSSLQLRFTASQTLNGNFCPATSNPITVRAVKAIDP